MYEITIQDLNKIRGRLFASKSEKKSENFLFGFFKLIYKEINNLKDE